MKELDLVSETIIAALVSGLSARDGCDQLGCTMGQIRAALDGRASLFNPAQVRASVLADLAELEGARGADRAVLRARLARAAA